MWIIRGTLFQNNKKFYLNFTIKKKYFWVISFLDFLHWGSLIFLNVLEMCIFPLKLWHIQILRVQLCIAVSCLQQPIYKLQECTNKKREKQVHSAKETREPFGLRSHWRRQGSEVQIAFVTSEEGSTVRASRNDQSERTFDPFVPRVVSRIVASPLYNFRHFAWRCTKRAFFISAFKISISFVIKRLIIILSYHTDVSEMSKHLWKDKHSQCARINIFFIRDKQIGFLTNQFTSYLLYVILLS